MSFFEPPPPEPPEPPRVVERPWWHAPRNEIGVSTGLRLRLARTEDLAVALLDTVAYSTGVSFTLVVRNRTASEPRWDAPDPFEHPFGHFQPGRPHGEELPPELLRVGVLLRRQQGDDARMGRKPHVPRWRRTGGAEGAGVDARRKQRR
jgi:hypothetical protein